MFTDLLFRPVDQIGKIVIDLIRGFGKFGILFGKAFIAIFRSPFRSKEFFKAMEFIGNRSWLLVALTGAFTGMVLALQMYEAMKKFSAESVVSGIIGLSLVKELGPVLTALMVNSRAGSAIAAELGSMRVSEQIDALESMAVDSIQYLISPRIFAGMVMLPLLTIVANFAGVIGGYLIAVLLLGLDQGLYVSKLIELLNYTDILGGLIKAFLFGLLLTLIGCYHGYFAKGGAEGVGNATTKAVVISSIMILFADYLITSFLIALNL